jgi:hypothetical protein
MAIVIMIVIVAFLAALFFVRVSHQHAIAISSLDDLSGRTQPVDLQAFQNLIDPSETAFLRKNLSPHDYRSIRRERAQATADYVQRIAHNAGILLKLGQAARASTDPEIARAAQSIIERALAVRMIAMQALFKLRLQALTGLDLSTGDIFDRYGRLTESVALFTRLQRPAYSSQVLAML